MINNASTKKMATRFRGYLPVVVDVETAGFDYKKDALLEVAAVLLKMDSAGYIHIDRTVHHHIEPFPGANLDQKALDFNGIDPYHPFRLAVSEQEGLSNIFKPIRQAIKDTNCTRAILVGHEQCVSIFVRYQRVGYSRQHARDRYKRTRFIQREPFQNIVEAIGQQIGRNDSCMILSVRPTGNLQAPPCLHPVTQSDSFSRLRLAELHLPGFQNTRHRYPIYPAGIVMDGKVAKRYVIHCQVNCLWRDRKS